MLKYSIVREPPAENAENARFSPQTAQKLEKRTPMETKMLDKITAVLKKYPVKRAGVFGSYARGDQTAESDLDLMIEVDIIAHHFGLGIFTLWGDLEEEIGMKIDLLTTGQLKDAVPRFQSNLERDLRWFYEV